MIMGDDIFRSISSPLSNAIQQFMGDLWDKDLNKNITLQVTEALE